MGHRTSPSDLWRASTGLTHLMLDAQAVMAYRTLGMMGLWAVAPGETQRMVNEKAPAFAQAMMAATRATLAGQRPDQIFGAWMAPLRRRARSNARRLGRVR